MGIWGRLGLSGFSCSSMLRYMRGMVIVLRGAVRDRGTLRRGRRRGLWGFRGFYSPHAHLLVKERRKVFL